MNHAPAWLSAATADKAMAFAVAGGVLLVIILLARAVGRLAKAAGAAAAPAPAPKSSGGSPKLLLLAGLGGAGFWYWDTHLRHAAAGTAQAAPAPSPSPTPRPTVTQTVAPHVTAPVHLPLSGRDIVILFVIAAVVAIVLLGPLLRRSS